LFGDLTGNTLAGIILDIRVLLLYQIIVSEVVVEKIILETLSMQTHLFLRSA